MSSRRPTTCFRFTVVLGLLAAVGCTPIVDARGNLPAPERLAQIKPGEQTRDEVAHILGTPSTLSAFGDPVWYYVSYRTETVGLFAPEEVDRKIVAVEFDDNGYVKDLETYGLTDGKKVEFVERETPTAGKQMSVLQQFFGNIGRFQTDSAGSGTTFGRGMPR